MNLKTKLLGLVMVWLVSFSALAQVTTSMITGRVKDKSDKGLGGATIVAIHEPSGTTYRTTTQADGSFTIPGMRVGGPYKVTISYVGYKEQMVNEIYLQLGIPTKLTPTMESKDQAIETVWVTGKWRNKLIGSDNKGTGTNISRRVLESLPTLSRSFADFTKLTPQSNGVSFGGQDNRLNNITIDGSSFNNSFGLQPLLGSQTNSTPISLDAIEEIQVNLSPYSVREGGFTGAGVNAVTRSGTNTFHGSAFYNQRNEGYIGTEAGKNKVITNAFDVKQFGFRFGGPIIKNKLFFFLNGEAERRNDPGTTFRANNGSEPSVGNVTRVLASDLNKLTSFLKDSLGYDPGSYQDYSMKTYSNKALAKIDWNINDRNRFSFRFNYLRSYRDVPISNSGGFNGRRDNLFAIAFQNSNYKINNDLYSAIAELNSTYSNRLSNNIIFGFTAQRDYRSSPSTVFPLVDILDGSGGRNYTSFGYEPFTPNNKLNTNTWQFQDNLSMYRRNHTITGGVQFEALKFFNSFTPTLYGQYVFSTLNDFYTAARSFIKTPNASSPVTLERYVLGYSALPGHELWAATTKAYQASAYVQDDWKVNDRLNVTYGVRFDVPFFGNTGYQNDSVDTYKFYDENLLPIKLSTSKLPGAKVLVSPRLGFNLDVNGNKKTQIRGGVGVFTGKPPFVFISNQIGNNGVQSGQISVNTTKDYAFNTDVTKWIPGTITVPAPSYNIAVTNSKFKYPQILRGNFAIDQQLPWWGLILTAEVIASRGINDIGYIQANLKPAIGLLPGPDNRPMYAGFGLSGNAQSNALRINSKITDATVLKNMNGSMSSNYTVKLERPFQKKWSFMVAYNYGRAKDYISPGSIAFSSWSQNFSVSGNNYPQLSFSNNDLTHRVVGNIGWRQDLFHKKATLQLNLYGESRTQGRFSYVYTGDANGDGISGNDLIYVPKDFTEMNFEQYTSGGTTYTVADQVAAYNKFIDQDKYLSKRRGMYAERNGVLMPWVTRFDLSAILGVHVKTNGVNHTLELRADIFNVGNLLNKDWGVGDVINNSSPIAARNKLDNGLPLYRMNTLNGSLNYTTYRNGSSLADVWQAQFGVRYSF